MHAHTLPHAQAAIHCLSLERKLMGWPGFQVSEDGIQVGFQDFKSLMDLLVLNPQSRSPGGRAQGPEADRSARVQGRLGKPVLFGSSTPI